LTVRLIVALDYADARSALALADALGSACDFYKVGSELFTAAGPELVRTLIERGSDVFLDLKFHDIPKTMSGAARSAAALGVRLLTVHASAGREGIRAAVDGAGEGAGEGEGERCGVLAVSVLTSMDGATVGSVWGRSQIVVRDEVLRLADLAAESGAHGLVCAGTEAAAVHARHGALRLLVPAIRPTGTATHDQSRVVTPREAVDAGASYLVVGRAVTEAGDPVGAFESILQEIGTKN